MELLQTVQYFFVNRCDWKINVWSTEFAYLLVIVQPLMWNLIFYMRSKEEKHKNIFKLAIIMCVIWIAMNVYARVSYHPDAANNNNDKCGFFNYYKTCTMRDKRTSHLYWRWTTKHLPDLTANYFMYLCLWFVPALLVPHTKISGVMLMVGALIGYIFTRMSGGNMIEFPAIWCYISVPIVALGYLSYFVGESLF